jgi:hypothetical protein
MTLPPFDDAVTESAVVQRALAQAIAAEHDLVFLLADDEDWPKELYAKLGFEPLESSGSSCVSLANEATRGAVEALPRLRTPS